MGIAVFVGLVLIALVVAAGAVALLAYGMYLGLAGLGRAGRALWLQLVMRDQPALTGGLGAVMLVPTLAYDQSVASLLILAGALRTNILPSGALSMPPTLPTLWRHPAAKGGPGSRAEAIGP